MVAYRCFSYNFKQFMKRVWIIDKRYFFYVLIYGLTSALFSMTLVRVPGFILGMVQQKIVQPMELLIIFSLLIVSGLVNAWMKYLFTPIGNRVRYQFLYEIMEQDVSIPLSDFEDADHQNKMWTIYRSVSSIDGVQGFYLQLALLIGQIAIIAVSVGFLFILNIWIAIAVFGWFVIFLILSVRSSSKAHEYSRQHNPLFREYWYLGDTGVDVAYAKELRVFQLQSWYQDKFSRVIKEMDKVEDKIQGFTFRVGLLDDAYQMVRDLAIYIFLIVLFFKQQIGISELATYSVLLLQLNQALQSSVDMLTKVLSEHENFQAMFEYLDLPKQSYLGESVVLEQDWEIVFKDVSFKYPQTEHWIYQDLNFSLKKGEKIALVGLNGVGKTTLLKLLMRLISPTEGVIYLNGADINTFKLDEYFALFAPVFQEINLFPFSVRDNLVFGHDVPTEILEKHLRRVGIDEDLISREAIEQKEMTRYLNEDGLVFSGGQAQKFVSARALSYGRPIYILDEPTSALDAQAEHQFYHNLETVFGDSTMIFVSHRLASTQFCDRILLIDESRIAQQGTHQELLQQRGKYSELFAVQSKYYKEEI